MILILQGSGGLSIRSSPGPPEPRAVFGFCSKFGNWLQRKAQGRALESDISLTLSEGKQTHLEFIRKVV